MIDQRPIFASTPLVIERLADHTDHRQLTAGRPAVSTDAPRIVAVRLDPELQQALRRRVERDQTNNSAVIRDALRAWLEADPDS